MGDADTAFESYRRNSVDGVTVDSFEKHLAALNKTMKLFNIKIKNEKDLTKYNNQLKSIRFL